MSIHSRRLLFVSMQGGSFRARGLSPESVNAASSATAGGERHQLEQGQDRGRFRRGKRRRAGMTLQDGIFPSSFFFFTFSFLLFTSITPPPPVLLARVLPSPSPARACRNRDRLRGPTLTARLA